MTSRRDTLGAAAVRRTKIIECLQPFYEVDMNDATAPYGMTCYGLADKLGRNQSHVYQDIKWLEENGYIKIIGKRHATGKTDARAKMNIYMLTNRGRAALNNH